MTLRFTSPRHPEERAIECAAGYHGSVHASSWAENRACPWCDTYRSVHRLCFCPDDCNCHYPHRPNLCGCRGHDPKGDPT